MEWQFKETENLNTQVQIPQNYAKKNKSSKLE